MPWKAYLKDVNPLLFFTYPRPSFAHVPEILLYVLAHYINEAKKKRIRILEILTTST